MLNFNLRRRMAVLLGLLCIGAMVGCNLPEPNNNNITPAGTLEPVPDATLIVVELEETLEGTPTPIATWEVTPTLWPADYIIHPDSDFDMEIAISELGDIGLATLVFTVSDEDGQPIEKGLVSLKDLTGIEHILIVLDGTSTETVPFMATPGIYALEVFEETADEFLWLSVWDVSMEQQVLFIFEVQAGEMWDFIVTRISEGT